MRASNFWLSDIFLVIAVLIFVTYAGGDIVETSNLDSQLADFSSALNAEVKFTMLTHRVTQPYLLCLQYGADSGLSRYIYYSTRAIIFLGSASWPFTMNFSLLQNAVPEFPSMW